MAEHYDVIIIATGAGEERDATLGAIASAAAPIMRILAFIGELLSEVLAEAGPRVGLTQYRGLVSAALGQCMAERRFPKEDHPREALLLDRAHPALRIGIQVGRSGWQDHTLDTSIIDEVLKRGAEFGVAVMDEILAGCQEP